MVKPTRRLVKPAPTWMRAVILTLMRSRATSAHVDKSMLAATFERRREHNSTPMLVVEPTWMPQRDWTLSRIGSGTTDSETTLGSTIERGLTTEVASMIALVSMTGRDLTTVSTIAVSTIAASTIAALMIANGSMANATLAWATNGGTGTTLAVGGTGCRAIAG